ncbi:MAG: SDR family NAD(P)-dependent oxidoreductase [Ekhidna sp.]|nr:SDR family NAD(P)-dependent oxidoreductase [Ekhidna sp.]
MKVALTGSNGFLGAHIVKKFVDEGHEVIALVRPSADTGTLDAHDKLYIESIDYKGNLTDRFLEIKEKYGELNLFIHNAGVTVSLNPGEYFEINTDLSGKIVKSVEACDWIKDSGKILHVSSLTARGPVGVNKPVSKYGESKLKAETFFKESKYEHLIIRPTAIYGAGDYAFLPLIKGANRKVYPLTNSEQKMSMIHGKDLANMILVESAKSTGTLHAADGKTYLHSEFASTLSKILNKKVYTIPIPTFLSKLILSLSDVWHKLINKRPSITKEKFLEISMDWNQHEYDEVVYSQVPCEVSLEEGFKDAYDFYKAKKLI